MVYIHDMWATAPEHEKTQWASIWMVPHSDTMPSFWPFTVDEVIARLNEWLDCLDSNFQFVPDLRLREPHYAWMQVRDHGQAFAVALLGRMAAQTLLDERSPR